MFVGHSQDGLVDPLEWVLIKADRKESPPGEGGPRRTVQRSVVRSKGSQ
jgi:hypothetical protein